LSFFPHPDQCLRCAVIFCTFQPSMQSMQCPSRRHSSLGRGVWLLVRNQSAVWTQKNISVCRNIIISFDIVLQTCSDFCAATSDSFMLQKQKKVTHSASSRKKYSGEQLMLSTISPCYAHSFEQVMLLKWGVTSHFTC
jgi:hypothetical protein